MDRFLKGRGVPQPAGERKNNRLHFAEASRIVAAMELLHLSPAQLRQAGGLKERIEALQDELHTVLGFSAAQSSKPYG